MKRILTLLVIVLYATVCASAEISARDFFKTHSTDDDITSVYISKALISMIPNTTAKGVDIHRLASKLNYIYILSSDSETAAAKLSQKAKEAFTPPHYEQLLGVNSGNEFSMIYYRKNSNDENEYIILSRETNEFNAILIVGAITPQDVQGMISD